MVSTRTPKLQKSSYAERVLGAFSQIQREHKKHAIHPAALRAQVKKDAEAKKDKLGPNWTHWVGRALTKMEAEGILEPATPNGKIALTSKGKKAINYARRSIRQSTGTSRGRNEDGMLWKEVVNYSASKRRRSTMHGGDESDEEDDYRTPSKPSPAKKRVRMSVSPVKKTIMKMTKAELRAELDKLQKKELLRNFEDREPSPLTELESDEDTTTDLREGIREHDEEVENMRRELFAARKKTSTTEAVADNFRFPLPQSNIFTAPSRPSASSPMTGDTSNLLSRKGMGGVVRTESGSYIPNLSRRPTPAPSSPGDMDYDERDFGALGGDVGGSLETPSHDNQRELTISDETRATHNHNEGTPFSRRLDMGAQGSPSHPMPQIELERRDERITALYAEINKLTKRITDNALLLEEKDTAIAVLEKYKSEHIAPVADREGTIDALGKENAAYKTEVASLQDSWRRADEMVTTTTEKLRVCEAQVADVQSARESELLKVKELTASKEVLLQREVELKAELEQSLVEISEMQVANEGLQTENLTTSNELVILREETDRLKAKINEQVEALEQTAAENRLSREANDQLELSVTNYQNELDDKQRYAQKLKDQLSDKEREHAQVQTELAALRIAGEELYAELSGARNTVSTLTNDLNRAQKEQEALKLLTKKVSGDLKSEETKRRQFEESLSETERELDIARRDGLQARSTNEILVAEMKVKDDTINRVSDEKSSTERQLLDAERTISDLGNELDTERMATSRAISDLEDSLSSATADNKATKEAMERAQEEKTQIELELETTRRMVKDLDIRLGIEKSESSALKSELIVAEDRAQKAEEDLLRMKEAKRIDDQTILTLKQCFLQLRASQAALFDEAASKINLVGV